MRPGAAAPFNMARYCIGRTAAERPEHPALIVISAADAAKPSEVWSYQNVESAILRVADALRALGLAPGARIVIRLENTSAYALLFFGAIAGGYVPLPTSTQLTEAEVRFLIEDSGAEAIAVAAALPVAAIPAGVKIISAIDVERMLQSPQRAAYANTSADDPAFLVYTSGTTAKPKGVLHAHRSTLGRSPMYQGWYGITPDDRMLHAGAFNWTYTLGTGLTDPWANGATAIVYTGEKDPALWPQLIRATGATLFAGVPGLYRQILKYVGPLHGNLGALRHGLMAGEPPPPGLFEAWDAATGLPLYEALGMSELSTYISSSPSVPRRKGTVGRPQLGRRVAILPLEGGETPLPAGQEGLIAVHRSDPGLMLGYWNRKDEESHVYRGEWFTGGDIGCMDADGYVTHLGRANDIMKAQGYRVAPQEVEAVIALCPGVADVACAEIQVRDDISVVGAFVVRAPGSAIDAATVLRFAAERLAAYKTPRQVVFLDALPRTPNGKIKRSQLQVIPQNV